MTDFPIANEQYINNDLEARQQIAQDITSMILALRRKVSIKVRQPLQCIMIPVVDDEQRQHIEAVKELIKGEVNVKEVKFIDDTAGVLIKKIKLDFKKLGPKFGKQMKQVAGAVEKLTQQEISTFEKEGAIQLELGDTNVTLETADVTILNEDIPGWLVANEGKLTVALEVTLTDDLRKEGIARELVNRIQNLRKQSGFDITDKIHIELAKNKLTDDAVTEYNQYICGQVLGLSLQLVDEIADGTVLNFDDFDLMIKIMKDK